MNSAIQKTGLTLALVSMITFAASDAMAQYGRNNDNPDMVKKGMVMEDIIEGIEDVLIEKAGVFRGLYFMKENLKLSDAQVLKIMDIKHEFHKKVYKNRNDRTKILEYKLEMRKSILRILTKEQRKKFNEMPRRRYHRPNRRMR